MENNFSIASEALFKIGDFTVTNTVTSLVLNLVFFLILIAITQSFKVTNPNKFQLAIEGIFSAITGFIDQLAGGPKKAEKVKPVVFVLIFYLLVSNLLLSFLPILSGLKVGDVAMFRSATNDFNSTLAIAICMVLLVQITAIRSGSFIKYIFKFFPINKVILGFRKGIKTGLTSLIDIFIGLLDIVSELARVLSLSLRLFGNMFAGDVLLSIFLTIFAVLLPIPVIGLGLLSGSVQAVVFGALVTSYLLGASETA